MISKHKLLPLKDRDLLEKHRRLFPSNLTGYRDYDDLVHQLKSAGPHDLCEKCSRIDFPRPFGESRIWLQERLEEARRTKDVCPLCRLVVETIQKAWPNLKLSTRPSLVDGRDPGLKYKVFSYKPRYGNQNGPLRLAFDVGWGDWSQTSAGHPAEPDPDLNSEMMSFELVDVPSHRTDPDGIKARRQPVPGFLSPDTIYKWLAVCELVHDHPLVEDIQLQIGLLGLKREGRFRIIDVKTCSVISVPVELNPKYFALSYEWGQSTMQKPTERGIALSAGVLSAEWQLDLNEVPRVIRDAVLLLQQLDIRYLWVDQICIDQTDDADKGAIVSRMGDVYQCAYATIVAACGGDDVGLTRINPSEDHGEAVITFSSWGASMSFLPVRAGLEGTIKRSSWSPRGWTYQERLLSRRCLFFLKEEVFFECSMCISRESQLYEDFRNHTTATGGKRKRTEQEAAEGNGSLFSDRSVHGQYDWHIFKSSVEEYTQRRLTFPEDRLNAYRGILAQLIFSPPGASERIPDDILNGLPHAWFLQALLWQPTGSELPARIKRKDGTYFPSWSWVAWKGPVRHEPCSFSNPSPPDLRVIDSQNIVLSPAKTRKYLGPWPPWPPCMPNRFEWTEPSTITIHIYVLVIRCVLVDLRGDGSRQLLAVEAGKEEEKGDYIAHSNFGNVVGYVTANSARKQCELALLPCSGRRSKPSCWLPAVVIERHGAFVERVPCSLLHAEATAAKKHGKFEYLRLR